MKKQITIGALVFCSAAATATAIVATQTSAPQKSQLNKQSSFQEWRKATEITPEVSREILKDNYQTKFSRDFWLPSNEVIKNYPELVAIKRELVDLYERWDTVMGPIKDIDKIKVTADEVFKVAKGIITNFFETAERLGVSTSEMTRPVPKSLEQMVRELPVQTNLSPEDVIDRDRSAKWFENHWEWQTILARIESREKNQIVIDAIKNFKEEHRKIVEQVKKAKTRGEIAGATNEGTKRLHELCEEIKQIDLKLLNIQTYLDSFSDVDARSLLDVTATDVFKIDKSFYSREGKLLLRLPDPEKFKGGKNLKIKVKKIYDPLNKKEEVFVVRVSDGRYYIEKPLKFLRWADYVELDDYFYVQERKNGLLKLLSKILPYVRYRPSVNYTPETIKKFTEYNKFRERVIGKIAKVQKIKTLDEIIKRDKRWASMLALGKELDEISLLVVN